MINNDDNIRILLYIINYNFDERIDNAIYDDYNVVE